MQSQCRYSSSMGWPTRSVCPSKISSCCSWTSRRAPPQLHHLRRHGHRHHKTICPMWDWISKVASTSTRIGCLFDKLLSTGVRQTFLNDPRSKGGRTGGSAKQMLKQTNSTASKSSVVNSPTISQRITRRWNNLLTYVEEHKQQIFYLTVFYVAIAGAWLERFSCKFFPSLRICIFSSTVRLLPL